MQELVISGCISMTGVLNGDVQRVAAQVADSLGMMRFTVSFFVFS